MPIRCEVVSVERVVYEDDVDMVLAPGTEGMLGILPHHAALMTGLAPGELTIRKAGQEDLLIAIGGGFMEVRPDRVTILADSAEKADEIDLSGPRRHASRAQQLLARETGRRRPAAAPSTPCAARRSVSRWDGAIAQAQAGDRPGSPITDVRCGP